MRSFDVAPEVGSFVAVGDELLTAIEVRLTSAPLYTVDVLEATGARLAGAGYLGSVLEGTHNI
jgi:hypothetical protein